MAGYGNMGGGFNTYKEVKTYQDDWENPITTLSERGVQGYVVRTKRIVQVRHTYDSPLNGLLNEYKVHDEWDDHSPRKVHDFFDKVHNEASRPNHHTLLSPPKWGTRPNWGSEDHHGSPKYSDHRDFSASPPRDKFSGLHLRDDRGSSPYSPKKGNFKDYGVNNKWDSPPRSTHRDWDTDGKRRGHDDYDTNRGTIPYSYNKDDHGKPKFNGGYKTTSPPLSQDTNDIGTAMKLLEEGNKPLASPTTYAPQSHFPASYTTPYKKESYPERTQGAKPLTSHVSTHPSHYPITERKESYPEPTKGMKPLFTPSYTQEPHSPTSSPTTQRKESYPETAHGAKPRFSPVYAPQSHSPTSDLTTPQKKERYPEAAYGVKPLFSPGYTQQPHSPTSSPTPQRKESYPETTHGAKLPSQQPHFSAPNPTFQNNESYPNKTQGGKPLFSSAQKQQPHPPTPETKDSYRDHDTHDVNPYFAPSSPEKDYYNPHTSVPQMKDHYSDNFQDRKPHPSPYEIRQEPRYGASVPLKETINSSEAKKKYANLKPASPTQWKYAGTIDSREAVEKYKGAFVP